MIFPAFVKITQLNSRGPHTTSACQELFLQSCQNFRKLYRTRPGFRRLSQIISAYAISKKYLTFVLRFGTIGAAEQDLTNLQIIARNPQKRLDIVYLLLYNRRKHFLSSSYYYLPAQEKKTMTKFAQTGTDFRGTRKKVVDLLLWRGGADFFNRRLGTLFASTTE